MKNKNFLKYVFSIDTKSTNRVIVYFLGFKFRHLKSNVKSDNNAQKYQNIPIEDIPKATGFLRKVQLADLKLMKIFDKLCKENNLEYWIDFGNLLGAVRHKGFIPWDDDVDVSMMRNDYEKFIELFFKNIDNYPDLYLEFNNNGKNKCFVKLLHKKISNIQIDIFPYDFYYKKTNENEKQELTKLIKSILNKKIYKITFLLFLNRYNAMRKRFKRDRDKYILQNHTVDETKHPTIFCGIDYPHPHKMLAFDYETIFPLKKIEFENIEFSAPNDVDKLLRMEFKNYMELPEDCYSRHVNPENDELENLLDNFINEVD